MKHLRGDMHKIPDIGKHPGFSCSGCEMNPFIGERFCCIECGGAEYDMDEASLISKATQDIHDTSAFNLCCFCFLDRIHDPKHHFIVFIDDGLICESFLNRQKYNPKHSDREKPEIIAENEQPNSWCELI